MWDEKNGKMTEQDQGGVRDLKFPKDKSISKKKNPKYLLQEYIPKNNNNYLYRSKNIKEVESSVQGSLWSSSQETLVLFLVFYYSALLFSYHFTN